MIVKTLLVCVLFIAIFVLGLASCSEEKTNAKNQIGVSHCEPASTFLSSQNESLLATLSMIENEVGQIADKQLYVSLFNALDEAAREITHCLVLHSSNNLSIDCGDCLENAYLQIKAVRSYLVSIQVSEHPVAKQDIQLIKRQIFEDSSE